MKKLMSRFWLSHSYHQTILSNITRNSKSYLTLRYITKQQRLGTKPNTNNQINKYTKATN
jgi:hypothetical protein